MAKVSPKQLIIKLPYPDAPEIVLSQNGIGEVSIYFKIDNVTTNSLFPEDHGKEMVALGFPVEENDVPGSVYPPRILDFNENRGV